MGQEWEQSGNKVGTKWEQSGNKNPKAGQEWEQSGNKVGTRTQDWDKNRNKAGPRTKKRGPEWTKWEQNSPRAGRMGTRTQKWDKDGSEVGGTKWEQERESGTRIGRKWGGNKNPKMGQEGEQSGNKVGART